MPPCFTGGDTISQLCTTSLCCVHISQPPHPLPLLQFLTRSICSIMTVSENASQRDSKNLNSSSSISLRVSSPGSTTAGARGEESQPSTHMSPYKEWLLEKQHKTTSSTTLLNLHQLSPTSPPTSQSQLHTSMLIVKVTFHGLALVSYQFYKWCEFTTCPLSTIVLLKGAQAKT